VNVGYHLVSTLTNVLKGELKDQVNIITQGHVTELLQSTTDRVIGVLVDVTDEHGSVTSEEVVGDAVILATGGFAADRDGLLTEFKPEYVNIPTTNGAFAQGEGIKLARAVGAGLQHMEFIQLHPTGIVNPSTYETAAELSKLLAPEALRGLGGLLLTREGKRFTNEVGYRDDVTQAIFDQKNQFKPLHTAAEVEVEVEVTEEDEGKDAPLIVAYLVINDAIETAFGKAVMGFYRSRGIVHTVDNAAGLATLLGAEVETLTNTFNSYNALVTSAAEADTVDAFGKTRFPEPFSPEERLHLIVITPVIHYCMGGLETNLMGVVQNAGGGNINGLFAAGEVSAGLHGANRLAGNSLSECVVFGRLAGLMATRI
jgi:succinate dehydrogenase/fumarate reductase flavoprotein subunit